VKPLVSVLMSVHNEERWVMRAVTSMMSQSYENLEIIIVNDGSTDDTLEILKNLQMHDDRIKIVNQENTGLTKALNNGLFHCKGKYVARMDADNIAMPSRIRKQVSFLEDNPDFAVVGSWRIDVLPDGVERLHKVPESNEEIQRTFVKRNCVSHSSVLVNAQTLRLFLYDERFLTSQDFELWTRIGKHWKLANLPEPLCRAYQREKGITSSSNKWRTLKYKLIIHFRAYQRLKCPWWYFIFIPKPIVEFLIPTRLIERYVTWKLR